MLWQRHRRDENIARNIEKGEPCSTASRNSQQEVWRRRLPESDKKIEESGNHM